jgi:hypothetical protein
MILIIKVLDNNVKSLNQHGRLIQNFYNRQKAYSIFALQSSYFFSFLDSILLTLNSLLRCRIEILPQLSMSITIRA